MATLFDISLRQLVKLQSLDPVLDENFEDILTVIFYILDEDSRRVLLTRSLNPKGIFYDAQKKTFSHQPSIKLSKISEKDVFLEISDSKAIRIIKRMQAFLDKFKQPISIDAFEFAEQLEAMMFAFNEVKQSLHSEQLNQIERAFLYELSGLSDNITFEIANNRRGINDRIIRIFLKEVYIKHAIAGINFCAWDADDLDGLEINLPAELVSEIKDRKLSVIETQKFWFLIAPTNTINANRYSLSRFLTEDRAFGLYVTYGCFVPKAKIDDKEILQVILNLIGTIYTLDKAVSPSLLKFIEDSKQAHYRHLGPLLRQKIISNGDIEACVHERLTQYEKKLSALVLSRMTNIMQYSISESDFFVFSHHVQKILADLWRDLDAFSMLPIAEFTESAQIMSNRLMAYRLLIQKNLFMLCDNNKNWQEKLAILKAPYKDIKEKYDEAAIQMEELDVMLSKAYHYEDRKNKGQLFAKLGFGRPKYSSEEVLAGKQEIAADFFIEIVRLAKEYYSYLVYLEFENPEAILNNDEYRHYAMAYAKNAVDRLPMIIKLPENRSSFEMGAMQEILEDTKRYEL